MRRTPSIVALLLALVACGALFALLAIELRGATPGTSPRESIRAATDARADARSDRLRAQDRSYDAPFVPEMVRDRVVWRAEPGGSPTVDVTIVNATPGADLAESARACAEFVGTQARQRVQCYAFADTASYEHKNITGDLDLAEPTAVVNLCWAVLASNQRARGPITISDMRLAPQAWAAQGCPSSWVGTGKVDD